MNRLVAASLFVALFVAGCASDSRQSVFAGEPNPYACSMDSTDWLAQINLCRWTE